MRQIIKINNSLFSIIFFFFLFSCNNLPPEDKEALDGEFKTYYDNGVLKSRIHYNDGIPHGTAEWFYENGNLQKVSDLADGHNVGSAYYYDKNGKLKIYTYYNFLGKLIYVKEYDKNMNIVKEKGSPLNIGYVNNKDLNAVKINERIKFYANLAHPPDCISRLLIGEKNEEGKFVPQIEKVFRDSVLYFEFSYNTVQNVNLFAIAEINDTINNSIYSDTVELEWEIIE